MFLGHATAVSTFNGFFGHSTCTVSRSLPVLCPSQSSISISIIIIGSTVNW